mgnify:FL=1
MKTKHLPMDIKSTLFYSTENSLENQIRECLKDTYQNEKPSMKSINAILGFAASYECIDTKIGKFDLIFN